MAEHIVRAWSSWFVPKQICNAQVGAPSRTQVWSQIAKQILPKPQRAHSITQPHLTHQCNYAVISTVPFQPVQNCSVIMGTIRQLKAKSHIVYRTCACTILFLTRLLIISCSIGAINEHIIKVSCVWHIFSQVLGRLVATHCKQATQARVYLFILYDTYTQRRRRFDYTQHTHTNGARARRWCTERCAAHTFISISLGLYAAGSAGTARAWRDVHRWDTLSLPSIYSV